MQLKFPFSCVSLILGVPGGCSSDFKAFGRRDAGIPLREAFLFSTRLERHLGAGGKMTNMNSRATKGGGSWRYEQPPIVWNSFPQIDEIN